MTGDLRLVLVLLLCVSGEAVSTARAGETDPNQRAKKVLVVGIDGCRPDALAKAETPHLDNLIKNGAFTDSATILGSRYQKNNTISGPGWSSILTGVWADKHGVHDNSFRGKNYELFPHFFKHLKASQPDARTVSLVSWQEIDEHIVSEADIRRFEPMPRTIRTTDLNIAGDKLEIDTRDGHWHHLLALRRGDQVELYLDGKLAGTASDTAGSFDLGGEFFYLGRDPRTGETRFKGQLDQIRIWKRALSRNEVAALAGGAVLKAAGSAEDAVSSDGLFAQYDFEAVDGRPVTRETPGVGRADDSAGHSEGPFPAEFVSSGSPPTITRGPPPVLMERGLSRHVLNLPQGKDAVQGARVPLSAPFRSITQGDFTIEAWFRTIDTGRNILMGNFATGVGALNLELHEGNRIRVYVQPTVADRTSALELEQKRDIVMGEKAARILRENDPTAMFVYFHQVDATGHGIGFSPDVPQYVQAIANVDVQIGRLMEAIRSRPSYDREDWLVIVCTDHGGIQKTHSNGHEIPEILTVFLIVSGPSANVGRIEEPAYLVDVAATALAHLGVELDPRWQLDGRPVGLRTLRPSN